MLREANLSNKTFLLLPASGDMVLTTSPISVLEKDGNVDKVARRLKSVNQNELDFAGIFSTMEREDVVAFLQEKSQKIEQAMCEVIQEVHGIGPSHAPTVAPSLSNRASLTSPSPRPR